MSNNSEKKMSRSPDRFTFQQQRYLERMAKEGKTPENNEDVADMFDYFQEAIDAHKNKEVDEEWKKNNLEYDLRSTKWICEKVKQDEIYAQNLYAAMCNNSFQKLEVVPILTENRWSCTWRYAGGIVADMREQGDYIDWYCSGIREKDESKSGRDYVSECTVTDEIREDLKHLGWKVIQDDEEY